MVLSIILPLLFIKNILITLKKNLAITCAESGDISAVFPNQGSVGILQGFRKHFFSLLFHLNMIC
jgi:hypothetical protein